MDFGINLGFAVKRLPEASRWAAFVRDKLGLDLVQFSFDLIDPWAPDAPRAALAAQVRQAVRDWGLRLHSAQVGLACYSYNGLLHPDQAGRKAALAWWLRAVDLAAELEVESVGGPLGGMSVADAASPELAARRYQELLEAVVVIAEAARGAGLRALLVEPTPLVREYPHTIEGCTQLCADLQGKTAVPIQYVLDIGHALYRPLYGEQAELKSWLNALREHIGVLHLQNTDFMSDSHWGWPDARGQYDVAQFAAEVRAAGLEQKPVFLEVFYPFEMSDEAVLNNVATSIAHCRTALA